MTQKKSFIKEENLINSMTKEDKNFFSMNEIFPMFFLLFLSIVTRLFMIQTPPVSVFKEKQTFHSVYEYLNRSFFLEKIQPTVGLLTSFLFSLTNQKKNIKKEEELVGFCFVLIRTIVATVCSFIVPISYLTLRFAGCSTFSSLLTSLFILFENGIILSTRFVQPTSFLLFFFSLMFFSWILFKKNENQKFESFFMFLVGFFGGFVLTTHLFGFIYYVPVIFLSFWTLWIDFPEKPAKCLFKKIMKIFSYLILTPLFIYFLFFYIHFTVLKRIGKKTCFSTRELQQSLDGGITIETNKKVYYGSTIVLRQERPENGYLHSNIKRYPSGSKQQQVTVYHHEDKNNLFKVRRKNSYKESTDEDIEETEILKELKNGDIIRLEHVATGTFLHSHHIEAPISDKKNNNEVSCYGHCPSKISDSNDNWKIEIVNRKGDLDKKAKDQQITAINTFIRLTHVNVKCRLHSRNKKLEKWAEFQVEVTCGRDTLKRNSVWVIEKNEHPLFKEGTEKVHYKKKNKIEKIIEVHQSIFETGKEDKKETHNSPIEWPFLKTNLLLWEKKDSNLNDVYVQKIILKGNKFVWFSGSFSVLFYILFCFINFVLKHMSIFIFQKDNKIPKLAQELSFWCLLSYFQHFFLTRTQTLFDYIPVLYISIILFGIFLNYLFEKISLKEKNCISVIGILFSVSFMFFLKNVKETYGLWTTENSLFNN